MLMLELADRDSCASQLESSFSLLDTRDTALRLSESMQLTLEADVVCVEERDRERGRARERESERAKASVWVCGVCVCVCVYVRHCVASQ